MATTRHIPVKFNPLDITLYKERVTSMRYLTQGNLDYARELALMALEAAEGYIAQIECDKNTIAELKAAMKTFNGGPADEQVKKYKEIAAHGMQAAELAQARVQDLELELAACRASKAETSSEEAKPSVRERDLQHQINMVNEDRSILEKKLGEAYWEIENLKQKYDDTKHEYDTLAMISQANTSSEPCNDCTIEELRKELVLAKKVIAGLNNSNLALMSAMEGLVK